jgi:hypothetical protein
LFGRKGGVGVKWRWRGLEDLRVMRGMGVKVELVIRRKGE